MKRAMHHQSSFNLEQLEPRALLSAAPQVASVIADNRGEVLVSLNRSVKSATVTRGSVLVFSAGPDGIIGNADDVKLSASVSWNGDAKRITIRTHGLSAGEGYRIKLNATKIVNTAGQHLDGEFSGTFVSGNGVQGGNFECQFKNDKSKTPSARMSTSDGVITLKLRKDVAPKTVANFLSYANTGRYDNIFWTRSDSSPASPFVIQGGSLQITGAGTSASDVKHTTPDADIADENPGGISNTIGTLSFAKGGPDTASNQFFINLNNNSFLDPASNGGGFTVFAQVTGGLSVAQATQQHQRADLTSQIGAEAGASNTGVTVVPVISQSLAQASLNPFRDLIVIRRIALLDKVAPLG